MHVNFDKEKHIKFILSQLSKPINVESIHATAWILYWSLNSLRLLGYDDDEYIYKLQKSNKNFFTFSCKNIEHLGNLYASIATLYSYKKLNTIDKEQIYSYLQKSKNLDGSFLLCENGDSDLRGIYCAFSICKMLNIDTTLLADNVLSYILSCQTYEGGFSSIPGAEAHGGYTYCAVATLVLLDELEKCDYVSLCEFLVNRQDKNNKLNGRTNKAADSCYSFWIGSCIKMVSDYKKIGINLLTIDFTNNTIEQIMECEVETGGFRDKGNNAPDLHHTCYCIFFFGVFDIRKYVDFGIDPVLGVVKK